jgi:hypothetical protein
LAHPYFASIDFDKLLSKQIEPPLQIDFKDKRFFNVKSDPHELVETIIPKVQQQKLEKNN